MAHDAPDNSGQFRHCRQRLPLHDAAGQPPALGAEDAGDVDIGDVGHRGAGAVQPPATAAPELTERARLAKDTPPAAPRRKSPEDTRNGKAGM